MKRQYNSILAAVLGPILVLLVLLGLGRFATVAQAQSSDAVSAPEGDPAVRVATFNASLNRFNEGELVEDLSVMTDTQIQAVAEIIQRTNPDVLLVNEFDYVEGGEAAELFRQNYLEVSQNGATPVEYPYYFVAPSNTGIPSGFDLDNNGSVGGPNDALGFGFFPGQYGMVVYSKFPILTDTVRTFQNFKWEDMPGALLPISPTNESWYSPEELAVLPLSSKSHWDVPVNVNGDIIHVLAAHPTPPVFDGAEDRNGTRNHDEIRFWADYVTPGAGDYIYDDAGGTGGLAAGASFVIVGDYNADPFDGDSRDDAIWQLLDNPFINTTNTPDSEGGPEQSLAQGGVNASHEGDPAYDTADFSEQPGQPGNLRVDYVLPSTDLTIEESAVFWPRSDQPFFELVGTFPFPSSDHRLVWADLMAGGEAGTLTLLHNNDGESSLLPFTYSVPPNTGYSNTMTVTLPVGSIAAFQSVTQREIGEARQAGNAVVNVYAGDVYLPSAILACSLPPAPPNTPIYDAVALRQIDFDALTIGNHEFDYGPEFFERFVREFQYDTDGDGDEEWTHAFLSANLDFSGEPSFDDLTDDDGVIVGQTSNGSVIARSLIVNDGGQTFGVVGASPPDLPTISSLGNVVVTSQDITTTAQVVQTEVDRLYDEYGIRKIVFASQLQNINNDKQLIPLLSRVDIAIAGGGNELLLNSSISDTVELLPGERAQRVDEYPIQVTDATSRTVYLVTTAGNYKYLGRLDVSFDAEGEVLDFNANTSYLRRIIPETPQSADVGVDDAVTPDATIIETVTEPVEACLEDFAETPIARTEVPLDVSRATVRGRESNAGNLIADSFLYAAEQYTGTPQLQGAGANPMIAVQNGGGIRQNAGDVLPVGGGVPGNIRRLDTLNVLPFANFVSVVQDVTPADLEAILERSGSGLPGQGGQFLQIAGFRVTFDTTEPAQELDVDGTVLVEGNRVYSATLEDGTVIIDNYEVVAGAPNVDLVTNNFTARGGDNYPWLRDNPNKFNLVDESGLQISYEQALIVYLQTFTEEGGLPTIQSDDERYQPGGEGRITITEEPTAVTMNNVAATPGGTLLVWLLAGAGLVVSLSAMAAVHRRHR